MATSNMAPAAPTGVVAQRTGPTTATVTINAVNRDTSVPAVPITIDKYNIWRCQISKSADPETASYTLVTTYTPAPTTGTFTWTDAAAPADYPSKEVYYKVSALDDCPNESARSAASGVNCQFNGAIAIAPQSSPPPLQLGIPEQITVSASGTDTFVSARLTIVRSDGSTEPGFPQTQNVTDNAWNFSWNPSAAGIYTATATVTNSGGCVAVATNTWYVLIQACSDCTVIVPFDPDPTSGSTKYYRQPNQLNNICAFDLTMTNVKLRARSLGSGVNNPLRLKSVQFVESGTFSSETVPTPVVSYAAPGSAVSPTSTTIIDLTGQPGGGLRVPASSASAKIRFIFYASSSDTGTQIWKSTRPARSRSSRETSRSPRRRASARRRTPASRSWRSRRRSAAGGNNEPGTGSKKSTVGTELDGARWERRHRQAHADLSDGPAKARSSARGERGSALVIAVLVIVIMMLLGLAFMLAGETESKIARNQRDAAQAGFLAEGAVRMVKKWFDAPDRGARPPCSDGRCRWTGPCGGSMTTTTGPTAYRMRATAAAPGTSSTARGPTTCSRSRTAARRPMPCSGPRTIRTSGSPRAGSSAEQAFLSASTPASTRTFP